MAMTTKQKVGAALLGLGTLGGVGLAIAAVMKKDKPTRPTVSGLFSSENFFKKRRLGVKSCTPCTGE